MHFNQTSVDLAVGRFRRTFSVGFFPAFDADDARQEATLAEWLKFSGQRGTDGYQAVIDALRSLESGFRQRKSVSFVAVDGGSEHDDWEWREREHHDNPEEILSAKQELDLLRNACTLHGVDVLEMHARGLSNIEIGHMAGVSDSRVSQVLAVARRAR